MTPERIAEIEAKIREESAEEDRLFYEWARGPGKSYPTEVRMLAQTSGAPLAPTEVWCDGWMEEFEKYKAQNWKLAGLRDA